MSKAEVWLAVGLMLAAVSGCSSRGAGSVEHPASQQAFHALNKRCQQAYAAGQNEIQKSLAFNQCNAGRAEFARTNAAHEWVGEISDISTDQGADVASVRISTSIDGFDVSYETISNRISDYGSDSLITPANPLFNVLAQMKEGDIVLFNADFLPHPESERGVWEGSLSEQGSMDEPEFNVRFTSIRPYTTREAKVVAAQPEISPSAMGTEGTFAAKPTSIGEKANDEQLRGVMHESAEAIEGRGAYDGASPSFDCRRASSNTEIEICSNATLARVDVYTAEMYRCLTARIPDKERLKAEQRAWLPTRDACENDVGCIRGAYGRIAEVYMANQSFQECQSLVAGER